MTDILTLLLLLTLPAACYAAAGRQTIPRAERLPLRQWRHRELLANIAIGHRQITHIRRRIRGDVNDPDTWPLS